jgi:kynurenine 3-monooxygenase
MANVEEFDGVVIIGGGLVGSLAAVLLPKYGYSVRLYEGRADWRSPEQISGEEDLTKRPEDQHKDAIKRSINLALSFRGQSALKKVGLLEKVMNFTVPMRCRAIHSTNDADSEADSWQPYDEIDDSNFINSVSRERLNNLLIAEASKHPKCQICFEHKLTHVDRAGVAHFENSTHVMANAGRSRPCTYNDYNPGSVQVKPTLILGCDGAYSSTREAMLRLMPMDFHREYIKHGYKELCIPPTASGDFAMRDTEALHIWPRGEFMMIALPNPDKSFTCTIFAPFRSTTNKETGEVNPGLLDVEEGSDKDVEAYFKKYFPDVMSIMPNYLKDFRRNPSCQLVQAKASPWNYKDKMLIMGDAAHAIVPFYGQGMNAGMEDVLAFSEALDTTNNDLSKAVVAFAKSRQPTGEAIAELSLNNYLEMRHHTGSKMFLIRKKIEGFINWLFPKSWVPLYKMVAFTRIPYDDAIARGKQQDKILDRVTNLIVLGATAGVATLALASMRPQFIYGSDSNSNSLSSTFRRFFR